MKIKVIRCEELKCPFYHAGHMGSLCCQANKMMDIPSDNNGKPPTWCPLKKGPITVKL